MTQIIFHFEIWPWLVTIFKIFFFFEIWPQLFSIILKFHPNYFQFWNLTINIFQMKNFEIWPQLFFHFEIWPQLFSILKFDLNYFPFRNLTPIVFHFEIWLQLFTIRVKWNPWKRKMSVNVAENSRFELCSDYFPNSENHFIMEMRLNLKNVVCKLESEELKRFINTDELVVKLQTHTPTFFNKPQLWKFNINLKGQ